jgi:hypothetical protein
VTICLALCRLPSTFQRSFPNELFQSTWPKKTRLDQDAVALLEPQAPANPAETLATVERYVAATGALIALGGEAAFYRPVTDTVHMHDRNRLTGSVTSSATNCYCATLLHELTHLTGIKTRCDREFGKRFDDNAYAMEELVAELGGCVPLRRSRDHQLPTFRPCGLSQPLADRPEGRQESDLHRRVQGRAGRRSPRRLAAGQGTCGC